MAMKAVGDRLTQAPRDRDDFGHVSESRR
jgi:hypothetical protein